MLSNRFARHELVSSSLAGREDDFLAMLLDAAPGAAVGVGGGASVIEVDGIKVFAKRIPITDRELARQHSTANLFDLPLSCQYGMHPHPGPGFGAWRELAANTLITEGVLAGDSESFALLHHWRVLPGRPSIAPEHQDLEVVVAQFDDLAVRSRLQELTEATFSLVLFLEYLPNRLPDRLSKPLESAETLERQLFEAVAFLRDREVLHMDGHFGNMRADDDRVYLVDFGLATSPRFELSSAERDFALRNVDHDADYAAMRLVNWLITSVCGVPASGTDDLAARNACVARCAIGEIPRNLPARVADILARHSPAAARLNEFYWRLVDGDIHAQYSTS